MEFPTILLTPTSVEYLGQALLASLLLAFLIYRHFYFPDRLSYSRSFFLMVTVYFYIVSTVLLAMIASVGDGDRRIWIGLIYPVVALMLMAFSAFIFRLPAAPAPWRREARIVALCLLGVVAFEVGHALSLIAALRQDMIVSRDWYLNISYLLAVSWLAFVLVRQTVQRDKPVSPGTTWFARFARPETINAEAARAYLIVMFLLMAIGVTSTVQIAQRTPAGESAFHLSFLSLVLLIAFVLIYVNYYAMRISFIVQTTAIMSLLVVLIVSTAGRQITNAMAAQLLAVRVDVSSLHLGFSPAVGRGYRVRAYAAAVAREVEAQGQVISSRLLPLAPSADQTARVDLPFAFPFFGEMQTAIYVHPTGYLTFGTPQHLDDLRFRYGRIPTIFALHRVGMGAPNVPDDDFSVVVETSPEQVRVLWYSDPGRAIAHSGEPPLERAASRPDRNAELQVQLNADGSFSIDINIVRPLFLTDALFLRDNWRHWVGIHDGRTVDSSTRIQWHELGDAAVIVTHGVLEDYRITVRRQVHTVAFHLAQLMLVSILTSIGAIPLFLRVSFMEPLQRLLAGIERTRRGDFSVYVSVNPQNEIGVIAGAFNALIANQRHLLNTLEQQVQDRTHALAASNTLLQREVELRRITHAALKSLNSELDSRVRDRTVQLSASEERFRRVVASVSEHIFAFRLDTISRAVKIEYVSPKLDQFVAKEVLATIDLATGWRTNCVEPDDWDAYDRHVADLLACRNSQVEYRIPQPDGSLRWVNVTVRCERVNVNEIHCYGVMSNITARKKLEQETAAHAALQEVERLRSEWIGNMSHELRTPLGLIKGAVTTLLAEDVAIPPAAQQRILTQLDRETDLLTDFVSNLLDLSRLESGRLQLNYTRTDIKGLLQEVIDGYTLQMRLGALLQVQVELVLASQLLYAEVDRDRLKRVVQNLLTNAMRFSPENSVIRVYAALTDEHLVIKVEDHGTGIDEVDFDRIFERYYQVKQPGMRNVGGVGLGLAICREIVKAHGGTITVASRRANVTEQGWTMFIVCLPCVVSSATPIVQEHSSQHA